MISIKNIGPVSQLDPGGVRTYEVRINTALIARFEHRRSDGLEVCLQKAAHAVKQASAEQVLPLLE